MQKARIVSAMAWQLTSFCSNARRYMWSAVAAHWNYVAQWSEGTPFEIT